MLLTETVYCSRLYGIFVWKCCLYFFFNFFVGENVVNVGNILPGQDIVNFELSDGEDEFYQPIPAQDDHGNDEQGKIL